MLDIFEELNLEVYLVEKDFVRQKVMTSKFKSSQSISISLLHSVKFFFFFLV